MALVYGSEPSTLRTFFSYNRPKIVTRIMASSASQEGSSQSTASAPASSPPIPIPQKKSDPAPITPINSREGESSDFKIINRPNAHVSQGGGLPTPGKEMPNAAHHGAGSTSLCSATRSLLNKISSRDKSKNIWQTINGDDLMDLRASEGKSFALPLLVDATTFGELDHRLSDHGGYEYDAKNKKVILKQLAGPVHEGVIEIFTSWFKEVLDELGVKRTESRVQGNRGLKLRYGSHRGSLRTPDTFVAMGKDKGTILLEVGVSQTLESLKERATMWLEGMAHVQLVILIHIEMEEHKHEVRKVASPSSQSHETSKEVLPYNLEEKDFTGSDFSTVISSVATKIRRWYKIQDPYIPLIKPQRVTIYMCRRPHANMETLFDDKTVLFDQGGFTHQEVYITPEDYGPKDSQNGSTSSKCFKLPLQQLKELLYEFMEEEVQERSITRAEKLTEVYGEGNGNGSDYHQSSEHTNSPAPKRSLRPRAKDETDRRTQDRERKRRRIHTGGLDTANDSFSTANTGSFASASSEPSDLFAYENDEEDEQPVLSNPSSFSKAAKSAQDKGRKRKGHR
ncbi:hypothetical protein B0O99DRAFT_740345 [Bisporella sp. PMI_857]|nr:hypothetical protein B0O99DRAFT_740345 [Bisporella sp. PMI_857]